ncbi:MAG: sensor histidine kinase [Syntrophomonadaceae bacterium]|nr:sensor histidine kinase [Syntrophomonadaceae bacterium]
MSDCTFIVSSNAIKYSQQSDKITIGYDLSTNYQEAQIKIMDNGSGISDEDLPYI